MVKIDDYCIWLQAIHALAAISLGVVYIEVDNILVWIGW